MAFGFDGSKVTNNAMQNASYVAPKKYNKNSPLKNQPFNDAAFNWQMSKAKTPEDFKNIDSRIKSLQNQGRNDIAHELRLKRDEKLAQMGIVGEKRYLYIDPTSDENANREQTFDNLKNQSDDFFTSQEQSDENQFKTQQNLVTNMTGILGEKAKEKENELIALKQKGQISTERYNFLMDEIKTQLADAQRQIDGGLTLEEYGNPNNKVMQATKQFYENEANQEQVRGLDNYGTLSALGAQSMNAYQNQPMTVSQQMSRAALSGRQASDAFGQAQKRIQGLRDQGLEQGFKRSDDVYKATEQQRQNKLNIVNSGANIANQSANTEQDFTKNITGMQNEITDMRMKPQQMQSGLEGFKYETNKARNTGKFNNKTGQINALYGARNGKFSTDAAKEQQQQMTNAATENSQRQFAGSILGGLLGAGGQLAGSKAG